MYWTQKHVLVCTASHCAQKGSNELIGRLRLEIVRKNLDTEILINNCGTIDLCDIGPNVIIYPDNIILSGVSARDVPTLVRYLLGEGDPPGEITGAETPAELVRRRFYRAALECGDRCPPARMEMLAIDVGLDDKWLDEQVRRGFMARKPDPATDEPAYTVTKKALDRYRLRSNMVEGV